MRRTIRSIGVLFGSLLGVVVLSIGSAFAAALAFGAVGLFVPGTGTPNANGVADYLSNARDRYTQTTACTNSTNCPTELENPGAATLEGINYPATFFPLFIFNNWCTLSRCNTWDDSVGQGTAQLNAQLDTALHGPGNNGQDVVVFGYSQGGAVVADSLNGYINSLSAADKARIQIVTIGGIENPDGGLWQRLNFIPFLSYIPFLNVSLNPPMNPNTGVNYTSIGFQYDPVVNAPKYFGNPFALINALAAFENVHGYYLAPNGNGPTDTLPFGYTDTTLAAAIDCSGGTNPNCKTDKYGNTYITIPATTLPIYNFILGLTPSALTPLVQPIVNLLTPVTRLLVDLGYDTSGDPSVPTPLSLLPFNPATFNPIDFSLKFVQAIAQGVQDALNGGPTTQVTPATTPVVTSNVLARNSVVANVDPTPAVDTTAPAVDKVVAAADVVTPPSTDQGTSGTDKGAATPAADKSSTDTTGTDKSGTDTTGTDKSGTDTTGTDKSGTDTTGTDKSGTDTTGTDKSGTDTTGTGTGTTSSDKDTKDAKDAADKAAKDKADKDAKYAADKAAKDVADKAKDTAAANGAASTGSAAKDATTGTTTTAASDAGASEKSAA
jgi:hypothetical protein